MEHYFVVDLTLILMATGIVTVIFRKLKQPVVLGYIVTGFLISPNFSWLPTVVEVDDVSVWSTIGIIFLMFGIGLEFSFHKIAEVGSSAIVMMMTVSGSMVAVGYLVGRCLGWQTMDCVFMGCMLSISSTMIILKAYEELNLKREKFSELVLGVLILEDIAGIFMIIILTTVSVSQNFSGLDLASELGVLLMVLVAILCCGIYIVPTLLRKIEDVVTDEVLTILSMGFCLLMVVVATSVGFSEALGAFLAGSILAGTTQGERIEHLILPIKNLFGAVFFVSVGMMIEPAILLQYWKTILLFVIVTIGGKMSFSLVGALLSGQSLHTAVRASFSMMQVGEFSFILASLGTTLGVTSDFLYPVIVCVSVVTTFVTPTFIKHGEKAYAYISTHLPQRIQNFLEKYTEEEQSTGNRDWKQYITRYLLTMLMGCSAMLGLYMIDKNWILPRIEATFENDTVVRLIVTAAVLSLAILAVSIMNPRRNILFHKLYLQNRHNTLPLLGLIAIYLYLSLLFATLFVRVAFPQIPLLLLVGISVAVICFALRSSFVRGRSIGIEARFLANFNQKLLAQVHRDEGKERWVDQELFVECLRLHSTETRKRIRDFVASSRFHTRFILVEHSDGTVCSVPSAEDEVQADDVLYVMGARKELDAYRLYIRRQNDADWEAQPETCSLREFLQKQKTRGEERIYCAAIPVLRGGKFAHRSLADGRFAQKYGGIIVGVERQCLSIPLPGKDFVLQEDDIFWALGTQTMLDELIKSGLLEHTTKEVIE